ncbi:arabinose-5-phosphate isomerase [Tepidamorphus gemmatus]|jgi:arabinose-5-phosphate isomerase|uniref:Arabinose-5-phosphate isomerase n=1 Tax=Tepidamorphus gemmatus TaxID=747076 RepID=A0A4R3MGZ9_9HYPH|nr:KpsF/GutQ family sugar-phosphate isomerase [Tepidamorphus gemmatus]TCT13265.1 arabinose-5-phosphate isomerase [Tepidamorphus gemmatus]
MVALKSFASHPASDARLLESALRALEVEQAGLAELLAALRNGLGADFTAAAKLLRAARGRVIVTGMGKSGHVGQKLAATLASTGTPAFFVHPSEASHGDLGMITPGEDVVIALSWSGETAELRAIVDYSKRFRVPLVAITSNRDSTLARAADVVLTLPRAREACPHGLAPTTSTLMQLALGDALAISLLDSRGFTAQQFRQLHPGGQLGAQLTLVSDLMHTGDRLPIATPDTSMADAIVVMTEKSLGCLGIVDSDGRLAGIITDGDLRRHMSRDLLELRARDIMTVQPTTVGPDILASEALAIMNMRERPFTALFVVEDGRPVGIVHVHDLLRAGVA